MEETRPVTGKLGATGALAQRTALASLLRAPLFTNALYLWASSAVMAVSGFVFWTLVATLYDTTDVGRGSAAVSALTLIALASPLGMGLGLIRFLPGAGPRSGDLVNSALVVGAITSAAASCGFLLSLPLWSRELSFLAEQPAFFAAFMLFAAASSVVIIQDQAFVALRRARYVFLRTALVNLVRMVLPPALVVFGGAFGIVAATGLATTLGLAFGTLAFRRALPGYRPAIVLDRGSVVSLMPFAMGNHLADLALVAPSLILPLMVVSVLGAEEAGYFYVGWFLGYILLAASVQMALSLFAEGSHRQEDLPRLTRQALTAGLATAGGGAALLWLAGDRLLLAFGADYSREATDVLRLVSLAALPAAITNVYLASERVRRRVGWLLALAGLVSATTLSLSYILLPRLGIAGAGLALLVGQGLGAAIAAARLGGAERRQPRAAPDGQAPMSMRAAAAARPRISVVICALNEAENIPHVLPRIPPLVDEVLLVDGHSTDGTVEAARACRPEVRILHQPGVGKGEALRFGVRQATGDIIVTLDADGETDPLDLPRFVEPLLAGHDFAKGSRFASGWRGKPLHRVFGNWLIVVTFNLLFGTRHTDLCSGYNAFWRDVVDDMDLLQEQGWHYEPLVNARVTRSGFQVVEIPQSESRRMNGRSKLPNWRQGFMAMKSIVRERFRAPMSRSRSRQRWEVS